MQQAHSTTEEDVEVYINNIVKNKSSTGRKLKEISNATSMDSDFQEVIHLTLNCWPKKEDGLNRGVKPYFTHRNDLSVHKKILYFQNRIVIPQNLRAEMLWLISNVSMVVENIPGNRWFHQKMWILQCYRAANPNESFKPTPLPDRQWQKVGTDILKLDGEYYLVETDYFSR